MKRTHAAVGAALMLGAASSAAAQVELSEKHFQPGVNFAAFFEVKHGCKASPTVSLRIEMPDGVTIVDAPPMPGWTLTRETQPLAVTWRGKLDADKAEQFGLLLKLPMKSGPLYFPAVQRCQSGEIKWTDIPAQVAQAPLAHPAPVLIVDAPGDMTRMANMPGMQHEAPKASSQTPAAKVTISDAWIRALPGGLPAAGYFRLRNAGSARLTMTGAQSSACGMLMVHKSVKMAGMAAMEEMANVDIPPGGDVIFAPGGYHLMCTKPGSAIKPGGKITVTLLYSDGSKTDAEFAVRDAKGG